MMKLYERLPDFIEVESIFYPIETDFRYWVKFEQLILSKEPDEECFTELILTLFKEDFPVDWEEGFQSLLLFYRLGKEREEAEENASPIKEPPRAYDFDVDAGAIYSLFFWEHGVDLFDLPYLHWWKFKELLSAAPTDTTFGHLVEIRTKDTSKMEKSEKKRWNELKSQFALEKEKKYATAKEMEDAYAEEMRKRMQRSAP